MCKRQPSLEVLCASSIRLPRPLRVIYHSNSKYSVETNLHFQMNGRNFGHFQLEIRIRTQNNTLSARRPTSSARRPFSTNVFHNLDCWWLARAIGNFNGNRVPQISSHNTKHFGIWYEGLLWSKRTAHRSALHPKHTHTYSTKLYGSTQPIFYPIMPENNLHKFIFCNVFEFRCSVSVFWFLFCASCVRLCCVRLLCGLCCCFFSPFG